VEWQQQLVLQLVLVVLPPQRPFPQQLRRVGAHVTLVVVVVVVLLLLKSTTCGSRCARYGGLWIVEWQRLQGLQLVPTTLQATSRPRQLLRISNFVYKGWRGAGAGAGAGAGGGGAATAAPQEIWEPLRKVWGVLDTRVAAATGATAGSGGTTTPETTPPAAV
jgi:hypothetical protein